MGSRSVEIHTLRQLVNEIATGDNMAAIGPGPEINHPAAIAAKRKANCPLTVAHGNRLLTARAGQRRVDDHE